MCHSLAQFAELQIKLEAPGIEIPVHFSFY
jgi:hypothetical protein